MTFDQKRDLLRLIFGSAEKDAGASKMKGERMPKLVKAGVYVQKTGKSLKYRIKGAFPIITGRLNIKVPLYKQMPYINQLPCLITHKARQPMSGLAFGRVPESETC